jgi:Pyridoxamine 5'-phosphate oxidase
MEPTAERLQLPDGYGRVTRTLAWTTVREALEQAGAYWVTTMRPDGRPHTVPVDGLWLDDVWYYGGSEQTVHYRNVLANSHAVMHLPDPARAVVVEGDVRPAEPPPELTRRLAEASKAKYGYGPEAHAYQGVLGLYPRRARAWTAFPTDATGFRFG